MACPVSCTACTPAAAPRSRTGASRVIDLAPYLRRRRLDRRRAVLHTILALWTQYLSLFCLLLYAALRLLLEAGTPLGQYSGPLVLLWPLSFFLLLTSYTSDLLLWREEWAPPA